MNGINALQKGPQRSLSLFTEDTQTAGEGWGEVADQGELLPV